MMDNWVIDVTQVMMGAALLLAFVRLVRGPSMPDRVVALDLVAMLSVGMIAVDCIATGQSAILVAAIALALVAFVGTVAFAYYVEKQGEP